jgi:hypothetical protein
MATGEIFISEYTVTPTISGETAGSINVQDISGGTAPYTIQWYGPGPNPETYALNSGGTFNISALSAGTYSGRVIDYGGLSADTEITVSAFTSPQFSATVTDNSCINKPNLPCVFTVWSAGTPTAFQSASTFNYKLYRDGELVKSVFVGSGTTSPDNPLPSRGGYYVFSGLTNGEYTFNIERISSNIQQQRNVASSVCTGQTLVNAGNESGSVTNWHSLSALTSAWTLTTTYTPGKLYIQPVTSRGGVVSGYTTGIFKDGIVTDSPNHWFFTGNSRTGALNYPQSNPNSGRTTDNSRNFYLGVTGASNMGEGYNWGPSGGNAAGHPLVDGTSKNLDGGTISGQDYEGMFYYNTNIQKFVLFGPLTGTSTSVGTYGWITINPTGRDDDRIGFDGANYNVSSGNPTSSLAITTSTQGAYNRNVIPVTWGGMVGDNTTYQYISSADQVEDFNKYQPGLVQGNVFTGTSVCASAMSSSFVSSCQYGNYTYELYLRFSGRTTGYPNQEQATADIILAQIKDRDGIYGLSGQTHQLVCRLAKSGTTILNNPLGSWMNYRGDTGETNTIWHSNALAFQRDLFGEKIIIEKSSNVSDIPTTPRIITSTELGERKGKFSSDVKFNYRKEVQKETFNKNISYIDKGLQTKEFQNVILGYPGRSQSGTSHTSPYSDAGELRKQGSVKIRVTRSGDEGEKFRIQFTDCMGRDSVDTETVKDNGDSNPLNSDYEINFNLLDKNSWSGASLSAPSWVTGDELFKYLGNAQIGFNQSMAQAGGEFGLVYYYGIGLTGNTGTTITQTPSDEINPIFSGTAFTLTSSATTNIIQTKECDYYNDCQYTVPKIKPQVNAIFQTLPEPDFDLSGGTSNVNIDLSGESIYNVSADTGMDLNIFLSGNTADFLNKQAYFKVDVYPYEFSKEKFSTKADYRYLFDAPAQVSTKTLKTKTTPLSASTFFPFSAFSTGTSWQFLVKPSSIFRDKSDLKNNVYIDTSDILDSVSYDKSRDSLITLISPPREPSLRNNEIQFSPNQNARMETENFTVAQVPSFDGPNSGFTYSGVTLNFTPGSSILVMVNGVTQREIGYFNQFGAPSSEFPLISGETTGDYRVSTIGATTITFRPRTVKNGDKIQVLYPSSSSKSFWKQSFTIPDSITTDTGNTIYRDSFYYYINLDYPALGATAFIFNGQQLVENNDFQRVGEKLIQLLTITYDGDDLVDCIRDGNCDMTLYYLTQYTVVGTTSTRQPTTLINYEKTLGFKESLKQITYNKTTGEVVEEQSKFYRYNDFGGKQETFTMTVPSAGTYNYRVIATRYYPLLDGKEITSNRITPDVTFEVSRQTFFSPYKLPGQRQINSGGGRY